VRSATPDGSESGLAILLNTGRSCEARPAEAELLEDLLKPEYQGRS